MLRSTPMATAHLVVSALLRRDGRVLLVREAGPDDAEPLWMLPGGIVERGESVVEALRRELHEETGLVLRDGARLAFVAHVIAAEGAHLALTFACAAAGAVAPRDPDGYVLDAEWVDEHQALDRLARVGWYDAGPLRRYLAGGVNGEVVVLDRR